MMITAFGAGFIALLVTSPLPWKICFAYAAVAAPAAAYVELISHGGNDTVAVPSGAALILSLLSVILK